MNKVVINTDGGARNNGQKNNVGGIGILFQYGEHEKEMYEGFRNVTNNEMEILAVSNALRSMKRTDIPVEIRSDSAYVINCMNKKWYKKWLDNGWLNAKKKPVENRELWMDLIDLVGKFEEISFTKVQGHSGDLGNMKADELANKAMDKMTNS